MNTLVARCLYTDYRIENRNGKGNGRMEGDAMDVGTERISNVEKETEMMNNAPGICSLFADA